MEKFRLTITSFWIFLIGFCSASASWGQCTNENACNYDASANADDGSCVFSNTTAFDIDAGFLVGFPDPESGCEAGANLENDLLYPVMLTENGYMFDVDEGLLGYLQFVLGMETGTAFYNETISVIFTVCDDVMHVQNSIFFGTFDVPWNGTTFDFAALGYYLYPASNAVSGCNDELACNYDDTPCILPNALDCTYPDPGFDCSGNPLSTISCAEGESALALYYDGADSYGYEFSFTIEDGEGNLLGSGADAGFNEFCVPSSGCVVVTLMDTYGDGHDGGNFAPDGTTTIFLNGEEVESVSGNWGDEVTFLIGECDGGAGCTHALACNYDVTATEDDGSCTFFDTDIFTLGEIMYTTTFVTNESCPGGLSLEYAYDFPTVGTPDAPIGMTITEEQTAELIASLGSLGELFAYEVANAQMSFCGNSISVDLQIADDFTSEWSGAFYPFTSLNTFGVPESVAGTGCNDFLACNYDPCSAPDPSLCTYPEEGYDCEGNPTGCSEGEDLVTIVYDGLDGYPEEFTFTVTDESGTEWGSGGGVGSFEVCIPAGACVDVMFMDEFGDGHFSWQGSGTTTIALNGEIVETVSGDWGSSTTVSVGDCGPACPEGESLLEIAYDGLDGYPSEFTFAVADLDGNEIATGGGAGTAEICIAQGACISVTLSDSYGDGHQGFGSPDGTTTIFLNGEEVESVSGNWGDEVTFLIGECDGGAGCTHALACNYDVTATEDDGSCTFFDTDIFTLGEIMYTTTFVTNESCPGGLSLEYAYDFPTVGTPDAPIGMTITEEQTAELIASLGSLGELFAYEVANAQMSFCGNSISVDLQIADDFTSEWSGAFYPFTSLNTFGVPESVAGTGCNDFLACNYDPCSAPDPSLCTYPEEGYDCEGNPTGCSEGEDLVTIVYDGLDGWSDEFTFTVTDESGTEWGSGADAGTFNVCIPAGSCAVVTLMDSYGDGQFNWQGPDGTTTIFLNGEVIETFTGNWGDEVVAFVGDCGIECAEGETTLDIAYDGVDGYPEEFSFVVLDGNGTELATGEGEGLFQFCIPETECVIINFADSYGDGHQGYGSTLDGTTTITFGGELVETLTGNWGSTTTVSIGECSDLTGCMDESACNYDPDALIDSGICLEFDECGICGGPGFPDAFTLPTVATWDEDMMGDFSSDASNPTLIPFEGEGAYVVAGSAANFQTANADPEYFTINVPAGYIISGVRMLEFDQVGYEAAGSPAGNGGFFGIGSGATLPVIYSPEDFVAAANALDGGALVGILGGTTEGFGLLDDLAQPFSFPDFGINIPGIAGALGEGTYTFMFKEGNSHPDVVDAHVNWSFAIEVSAAGADHYTYLVDCDGCLNDTDGDGVCDELEIPGCTDPSFCSYNPEATDDDGTCEELPIQAQYCGTGTEWSNEECGCVAPEDSCPTDVDNDGAISTSDLLIMLATFGTYCE